MAVSGTQNRGKFQSLSRVADHSASTHHLHHGRLQKCFNPSVGLPIIRPRPGPCHRHGIRRFNPSVGLPIIRPPGSLSLELDNGQFQSLSRVADHSAAAEMLAGPIWDRFNPSVGLPIIRPGGGALFRAAAGGFNPSVGLPIIRPGDLFARPLGQVVVSIPQSGCRSFGLLSHQP